MTKSCIEVRKNGSVTTILLNRPEVRNALNSEMHYALQDAFDIFSADDSQFLCILTASGDKAFCAGSDVKERDRRPYPPGGYGGLVERHDLTKPIIAAVNGLALGGGFELVLACDIVIAASTAEFGLPEPLIGVAAIGGGGLLKLPRQIGLKQAMGMILTADRVSAQKALELGIVNEVVPASELMGTANRWAAKILRSAPAAIRASKEIVNRGLEEPSFKDAMRNQRTYPAVVAMMASDDMQEGMQSFSEKRRPVWTGK